VLVEKVLIAVIAHESEKAGQSMASPTQLGYLALRRVPTRGLFWSYCSQ